MSCSASSTRSLKKYPERKEQDKLWRPCQDFETQEPRGKLCNRVCTDRNNRGCKKWKVIVKDFHEHFYFFRAGSFIMIDEDEVL